MAGLLEKDIRLLLQRKQAIVMFLVIAVVLGFSTGGTFVVAYTSFCLIMVAVGTVSYDEFDNGFSFLMTLPITRRTYIAEKYILCAVCGAASWIFSVVVCLLQNQGRQDGVVVTDLLMEAVVMLPMIFLVMDLMIPIQIKFGSEKSRIVLVVVAGIAMVVGIALKKLAELLHLPVGSMMEKMNQVTAAQLLVGSFVLAIAATVLSFVISLKIMNKKEF